MLGCNVKDSFKETATRLGNWLIIRTSNSGVGNSFSKYQVVASHVLMVDTHSVKMK